MGRPKREGYRTGRSHDDDIWMIEQSNRKIRTLMQVHKPSIAQVHGNCLAGGTDVALACDMVIAAEDARFGFPAARSMGAQPGNLWMYHCSPQWTKRLQLTGDSVTGADAAKLGLVMKAVPADVLEDEVEGLADRMSMIDADLLASNKRITNLALELMGSEIIHRLAGENDAPRPSSPGRSGLRPQYPGARSEGDAAPPGRALRRRLRAGGYAGRPGQHRS